LDIRYQFIHWLTWSLDDLPGTDATTDASTGG
jgi:hypothetical protein